MNYDDALKLLESDGKINLHLSPSDNAKSNLEVVLCRNLEKPVRSAIMYAIHVLKSSLSHSMVPVGLSADKAPELSPIKGSRRSSVYEPEVRDWLVVNYTPQKQSFRHNRENAKSISKSVRFAIKLYHEVPAPTPVIGGNRYVIDVESKELEEINSVLAGVDEWDWDIWQLEEASKGRPLQTLGWHLLHKWGLVDSLKLEEDAVRNWLTFVENMYQDNEYHNSLHAADVLQATHFLLARAGAARYLPPLAVFALLLSAMIHDAGHDGLNNLYHQNALTDRALAFNDQSIQENFHCMTVFTSMSHDPRHAPSPIVLAGGGEISGGGGGGGGGVEEGGRWEVGGRGGGHLQGSDRLLPMPAFNFRSKAPSDSECRGGGRRDGRGVLGPLGGAGSIFWRGCRRRAAGRSAGS